MGERRREGESELTFTRWGRGWSCNAFEYFTFRQFPGSQPHTPEPSRSSLQPRTALGALKSNRRRQPRGIFFKLPI